MRRRRGRDRFADRRDGDGFGERADFEPQRWYSKPVIREDLVVAALDRSEARELGANGVRTRLQCLECKSAALIGDSAALFLRLLVCDDDVGARNNLVLCVDDSA